MKRIYSAVLLLIYIHIIFLATGLSGPYCFQFTWPGTKNITRANCTKNIPCVDPIHVSKSKPNVTKLWIDSIKSGNMTYFCELKSDSVCVRYTYMYNGAVVNISYLCAKVIEDQTRAITSGCYAQYTEGYIIEACACQSVNGKIPCNSTIRNLYSIIITIVATTMSLFIKFVI